MLNSKIEICLELFESLNDRMARNKHPLFRFMDVVKANIINILNEIVENYTYNDPARIPYEGGSIKGLNSQSWRIRPTSRARGTRFC